MREQTARGLTLVVRCFASRTSCISSDLARYSASNAGNCALTRPGVRPVILLNAVYKLFGLWYPAACATASTLHFVFTRSSMAWWTRTLAWNCPTDCPFPKNARRISSRTGRRPDHHSRYTSVPVAQRAAGALMKRSVIPSAAQLRKNAQPVAQEHPLSDACGHRQVIRKPLK